MPAGGSAIILGSRAYRQGRDVSTLDLPQHLYTCADCQRPSPTGCREHPDAGVRVTPTLLHADFVAFTQACRLAGRRIPGDDAIWDRLESVTDTAGTNREAIENAISALTEYSAANIGREVDS